MHDTVQGAIGHITPEIEIGITKKYPTPLQILSQSTIISWSLNFTLYDIKIMQGLPQPGHITRVKNFETLFFQRYLKFLPVGNSNGYGNSPKNFF